MKLVSASASLAALLLIASPAIAQDAGSEEPALTEGQSGQELPEAVQALLNDARAPSELSVEELERRSKQARRFSRNDGLPGDVRDRLEQIAKAARQELIARQQASQEQAEPQQQAQTEEQPQPEAQPEPEAQTQTDTQQVEEQPQPEAQQTEAAPAPAELPPEVLALIEDGRPLSELSDDELKERAQRARRLSRSGELPDDVKARLAGISKDARAELAAREQAAQQTEPAPQDQQAEQPAAQTAEDTAKTDAPAATGDEQAAQPQPAPSQEDVKALDSNEASPEFEDKAQAYLNDNTDVTKLSDDELRTRLDNIRDVMATNKLSRRTERQVREKLREERRILRSRLAQRQEEERIRKEQQAQEQASATQENQQSQGTSGKADRDEPNVIINNTYITNRRVVLDDRRPSDDLADYELRRRIEVYRDAADDEEYADYDREYYRATLDRDRRLLRERLIEDRRRRERELRDGVDVDIDIGIDLGRDEPYSAYAAEVDDEELEGILVAAPRRRIDRRYTIDEIESSDELRSAIPRIEIDTIRFGFNEAFVREEEIENLDRVGEVIEKVLAKHPREVFLIEGHTDAVGSDAYNLRLSRQRAEAVKKALTTYFVIPPENLRTVGYGERYLKIPTADAEQENRRVSVARATDLVGELEE